MALTYEPIASTTLTNIQGIITFNSIPQTYTDLRIVAVIKPNANPDKFAIRFNNDNSDSYCFINHYGNGTTIGNENNSSGNFKWNVSQYANIAVATYSLITVDIFSYTSTSMFKTGLMTHSGENTVSGGFVARSVGLYKKTNAITTIEVFCDNGQNLDIGSVVTIYGIKAA